jgi:hypothetical protein
MIATEKDWQKIVKNAGMNEIDFLNN